MPAGPKRYRITIQRLKTDAESVARAASGQIDLDDPANWTTHCPRWAEILPAGGREFDQAGQVRAELTHLVAISFDSETRKITSQMRLQWTDGEAERLFDITRILGMTRNPGGTRWEQQLECKEHL